MFKFDKQQKIFDISGVKTGGQPGQLPTVMIGSIFYFKQKILLNDKTGEFDRKEAENLLRKEDEISKKTGNPRIVDVCASSPDALPKVMDFVAKTIEGPFTVDGITDGVRIAGAKYAEEAGLSKRVVYNSISPNSSEREITAIKEAKIKSAILLIPQLQKPDRIRENSSA